MALKRYKNSIFSLHWEWSQDSSQGLRGDCSEAYSLKRLLWPPPVPFCFPIFIPRSYFWWRFSLQALKGSHISAPLTLKSPSCVDLHRLYCFSLMCPPSTPPGTAMTLRPTHSNKPHWREVCHPPFQTTTAAHLYFISYTKKTFWANRFFDYPLNLLPVKSVICLTISTSWGYL